MGLLDVLNSEQGILALSLLSAGAPRPGPRDFGGGLLGALGNVQQFRAANEARTERQDDRAMRRQQFELQQEQQRLALQHAQEQAARQREADAWRQSIPSPQMGAAQQALSAGGGPTMANAQRMPAVDPLQQLLHGGMRAGAVPVGDYLSTLRPKAPDYKVVNGSLVQIGPDGVKEAYRAPDAPDAFTKALQGAGIDPQSPQGKQLALQHLTKMATHQPPTQVSVNTGQKGFDNTLKLRGDFRSEPIYKAHQEMTSAYSQIQQSLKQASPAGDLAGATKVMKLLDPGSVVRESELGMAMAASGALDRLQNYASNVINGTKLTPAQRKDFQTLADALYGESVKQYNAKRGEYQGIAERNGLSVPDVLGAESAAPAVGGEWSARRVR